MTEKKDQGKCIIQGLIVPVAWDGEGNPLTVAIATFDEKEYLVHRDEKGDQMLGLLRREVEVTGVDGIKDGIRTIKVNKCVLINKPEFLDSAFNEETVNHARE
jgi:hypothetical protein